MKTNKTISSMIYKSIEQIGVKGLGLIVGIILARLLAPEQFGQLAIITVFVGLLVTITESGLSVALVQNKDTSDDDYSTVFYISLVASLFFFGIVYILAPFVAEYYESPSITDPLRVYSAVTLLLGSFRSVQLSKMQREMKFKQMMLSALAAALLSGVAGIALAYYGAGLWALVGYHLINSILAPLITLVFERWYPRLVFSWDRAKVLFSAGWRILVSGLLCNIYYDIRSLIVGKKYTTETLGYYSRGQQFSQIVSSTLNLSMKSVLLPALSGIQEQKDEFRAFMKKSLSLGTFLIIPAMFGLAAIGRPLVSLLLTDKWLPCVIYMQLICLADATFPIISANLTAIKAAGRMDVHMKLEIVRRLFMLAILVVSVVCFDTAVAIAVGFLICSWLDAIIVIIPSKKLFDFGLKKQFAHLWKTILSASFMFIVVYFMGMLQIHNALLLLLQIVAGIVIYVAMNWALKNESLYQMFAALKKIKSNKTGDA